MNFINHHLLTDGCLYFEFTYIMVIVNNLVLVYRQVAGYVMQLNSIPISQKLFDYCLQYMQITNGRFIQDCHQPIAAALQDLKGSHMRMDGLQLCYLF